MDRLIARLRGEGATVGIVAVDPSSPFSGGAVLGDRIRMQAHFLDDGVFIRSLSTRGRHGGLARATRDVVRLLDASGKDFVLVETVGVGQTELDIMGGTIAADAQQRIETLPGVEEARVEIVWDPPWSPQMISPEGREKLGIG